MQSITALNYQIALTLLPGVGDVSAKSLISYCGSAEAVFRSPQSHLLKIPGIGPSVLKHIQHPKDFLERAAKEIAFMQQNGVEASFYTDADYPKRLKNCIDAPMVLYRKGNTEVQAPRILSIVGTRKASDYGKQLCTQLVESLKEYQPLIVSGLAYGIDIQIHRECLKQGLNTIAVLGHGLDRLYPAAHHSVAEKMLEQGALLSDYLSETVPDRENFPKRNRIIAGLSDATVVVEAAESGGAIITAVIANSYDRDVFAFPGRVNDHYSMGCHRLIKSNRAALVCSGADIAEALGWSVQKSAVPLQTQLPVDLSKEERLVLEQINRNCGTAIDDLMLATRLNLSILAGLLLELELKGLILAKPGKVYQLV